MRLNKGLLIGYDESHEYFKGESFFNVEYRKDRAVYDPTSTDRLSQIEIFAKRKSIEWTYENECRLIIGLDQTTKIEIPKCNPLYLFNITPHIIDSVTFGLRTEDEFKSEVKTELSRSGFSHIKLFQLTTSTTKYKLTRELIAR